LRGVKFGGANFGIMLSLVGELDMANLAERVPAQRILSAFDNEIDRDRPYKFKLRNTSVILECHCLQTRG
jgi:hypothetical protein